MDNFNFEKIDKRTRRLVDALQLRTSTLNEMVEAISFQIRVLIILVPKLLPDEVSAFVYSSRQGSYVIVYNERIQNDPLDMHLAVCHELGHILKGDVKRLLAVNDEELWQLLNDKHFTQWRAIVCSRQFEPGKLNDNSTTQQENQTELEAELIAAYLMQFVITSPTLANDDGGQYWSL